MQFIVFKKNIRLSSHGTYDFECEFADVGERGGHGISLTLPQRSMTHDSEDGKRIKVSKERLTVLVACSATGEKLPLLMTGKAAKPPLLPWLREGCTGRPLGSQLESLDDVDDLPPVAQAAQQLHGASGTSHPPVPAQGHDIQAAALRRRRNPDAETPLQETLAAPPSTQDGRLQLCRRPRE